MTASPLAVTDGGLDRLSFCWAEATLGMKTSMANSAMDFLI
jgi:hypothetical protein